MKGRVTLVAALIVAAGMFAGATDADAQLYFIGSGSVFQTNNSAGPGWQVNLGLGYQIIRYVAVESTVGYANWYIEYGREHLRVDTVPVNASVVLSYPTPYLTPYLAVGPTWTWQRIETRDWVNYAGAHAGVGLNIRLGPLGITPNAGYTLYDLGDVSRGSWTYGINFGFSFGG